VFPNSEVNVKALMFWGTETTCPCQTKSSDDRVL